MTLARRVLLFVVVGAMLWGCGGGGGGDGQTNPTAVVAPEPAPVTAQQMYAASRLAAQATFGMPYSAIEEMARTGLDSWLDEQFALPVTRHTPVVDQLIARRNAGEFAQFEENIEFLVFFRRFGWWHNTVTAADVLRQRVAFALSEIFVVSDNVDALIINPYALTDYYDMLLQHSFGNFRELLRSVALHPAMGIYLSHVNNRKADPDNNTFPDENFAREVMQLFSIGLFELNEDGSIRTDAQGEPIPTYGNDEIREFARVFTGLSYGGPGAEFGKRQPVFRTPMVMFDEFHDQGEKHLLNGGLIPAGQSAQQDFEDAIDNLFEHPNVGPFIARLLIARLVTSNPSPAYIQRVARAFNGSDGGIRGDMPRVIRAILRDSEASQAPDPATAGKLREPVVRYVSLVRQLNATSSNGEFYNTGYVIQQLARQHPGSAPSVFNFFLPDHMPAGSLADAGLRAPEFQITTSATIANMTNLVDFAVTGDFVMDAPDPPFGTVALDFSEYLAVAADIDALLDRLSIVFLYGDLSGDTREAVRGVLADIDDLPLRTRVAVYLILVSADYAVRA